MLCAEEKLTEMLREGGVDFTATLPCDRIKGLLGLVSRGFFHVPLTREEEGVGICAGAALTGKRPAMFIQNSGIGNMINALLSLTGFYGLPLAVFVSHRGVYKEKIAAQAPMGLKLPGILRGAGIGFTAIDSASDLALVPKILEKVYLKNRIHAFLLSPALWEGSKLKIEGNFLEAGRKRGGPPLAGSFGSPKMVKTLSKNLDRYGILSAIWPFLEEKAVVCNLGFPSRELYHIGHRPSHFYMLGSMGMATPVGLGIALSDTNSSKEVVVIDGDGSLLMNPGTLATAACLSGGKNLTILAVDNGAYGSTGNQPTLTAGCIDLGAVAKGFGLETVKAEGEKELANALGRKTKGPKFIHALALPGNRDVPVIPLGHMEIKREFMEFLRGF